MGLLDFNLEGVGSLLTSAREAITGKKVIDPTKMAEIERDLQTLENALLTGQMKINEVEAAHPSIFVSGWRPMVGWTGAVALAYIAIVEPLLRLAATLYGYDGTFPAIDTSITLQVLLGMLGIGGMRSFDKLKGTDTKRVGK